MAGSGGLWQALASYGWLWQGSVRCGWLSLALAGVADLFVSVVPRGILTFAPAVEGLLTERTTVIGRGLACLAQHLVLAN